MSKATRFLLCIYATVVVFIALVSCYGMYIFDSMKPQTPEFTDYNKEEIPDEFRSESSKWLLVFPDDLSDASSSEFEGSEYALFDDVNKTVEYVYSCKADDADDPG